MTSDQRYPARKIDVHHHIFLPQLGKRKADQNAQVGWITPQENVPWDLTKSLVAMEKLGVAGAVLSYPAGVPETLTYSPFRPDDEEVSECTTQADKRRRNRAIVRELNLHAKGLCESDKGKGCFGWFACLPDLRDVEGKYRSCCPCGDLILHPQVPYSRSHMRWMSYMQMASVFHRLTVRDQKQVGICA